MDALNIDEAINLLQEMRVRYGGGTLLAARATGEPAHTGNYVTGISYEDGDAMLEYDWECEG